MTSKPSLTCLRGHARAPENTWVSKDGRTQCRVCNRLNKKRRYHGAPKQIETNTERLCSTCGRWKAHAAFGQVYLGKVRLKSSCQECVNRTAREHGRKVRRAARRERKDNHEFVTRYFLDRCLALWYEGASDEALAQWFGVARGRMSVWFRGVYVPSPQKVEDYIQRVQSFRIVWDQTTRTTQEQANAKKRAKFPTRVNPLKKTQDVFYKPPQEVGPLWVSEKSFLDPS